MAKAQPAKTTHRPGGAKSGGTKTEVRSPTSTRTSTKADTRGNVTVTGGAGDGNTSVNVRSPGAAKPGGGTRSASMDLSSKTPWAIKPKKPEPDDRPGKMLVGKGPADRSSAQAARAKRLAGKPI